ncbi:MAG: hypothetical protein BWY00_00467 [Firmicutes bacterium ADurb.Bin153]|nr:MAG: hypothetical protein BWY00_00467 [Firmicutes bacterium ADurb.Bin153]
MESINDENGTSLEIVMGDIGKLIQPVYRSIIKKKEGFALSWDNEVLRWT